MNASMHLAAFGAEPVPKTCPQEPLPTGWRVWRGAVPEPLKRLAIDARDHIMLYGYGQIAVSTMWQGTPVAAFKSHHTYTFRPEGLVKGICIPGISLILPISAPVGTGADATPPATSLDKPDPDLALFPADAAGGAGILWGIFSLTLATLGFVNLAK